MKKKIIVFLFHLFVCNAFAASMANDLSLIPYPSELIATGKNITFISLRADTASLREIGKSRYLIEAELSELSTCIGMPQSSKSILPVYFAQLPSDENQSGESYTIVVSSKKILISAAEFGGFFNAIQTLRQLIKKEKNGKYSLPCCSINDSPAFRVRGVMFDLGRNYVPISFLKRTIRILSYYKINVLHLHLTDDPGWRLEIKKYPQLTDVSSFWKTRQPGKFYTQAEIKDLRDYCDSINVSVIPEIDMPGHSAAFAKGMGFGMQTENGMNALKDIVDEAAPLFSSPYFHVGSDEVHFTMKNFMSDMIRYVRSKNKEVIVWYPGYVPDSNAVLMCWGENEAGYKLKKTMKYIDCNGFYLDWMDAESGVPQVFFQQPCEVPRGNDKAMGSILCVWTDGALSSEKRILEQYPFYPCALTFAERIWRGNKEKRRDLMAQLPLKGTKEWKDFTAFEDRLIYHRDAYFADLPFAYVKQSEMKWRLIGPFNHHGINDTSFEPEFVIKETYVTPDSVLKWNDSPAYGGAIHIRSLYTMFNMQRGAYLDGWPTAMSSAVGHGNGTCYGLTYIKSPVEQEVYLMFGLNGMWGHSGGYRTSRAPEQGSWDFNGGDIWLNDVRISPPHWPFRSLPWTGWGQGRIETPLTEEGYFFRPPVKIKLKKGLNKILVRSVFGHWKGDDGERKWFFCCIPVLWDGLHYTEVKGLEYFDRIKK